MTEATMNYDRVVVNKIGGEMILSTCKCGSEHNELKFSSEKIKNALITLVNESETSMKDETVCRKSVICWTGQPARVRTKPVVLQLFKEFQSYYNAIPSSSNNTTPALHSASPKVGSVMDVLLKDVAAPTSALQEVENLFEIFVKEAPQIIFYDQINRSVAFQQFRAIAVTTMRFSRHVNRMVAARRLERSLEEEQAVRAEEEEEH